MNRFIYFEIRAKRRKLESLEFGILGRFLTKCFCSFREVAAADDCGVESILSHLARERNMNFGFGFREKGDKTCSQSNDYEDKNLVEASMDAVC